jgi:uncharacterized membrane protein
VDIRAAVDTIGLAVDAGGVAVIVAAIAIAALAFVRGLVRAEPFGSSYRQLRHGIGQGVLLGLELLVAGDIIRTVVIAPTFTSVGVLAIIVLIRTFLSFSLEVELSGRWPWQSSSDAGVPPRGRAPGSAFRRSAPNRRAG